MTLSDSKFYSYDPEHGFETHETEKEARDEAEATLEHYADQAPEGWHENVDDIEWGQMTRLGECIQTNTRDAEEGSGLDYLCDYTLKTVAAAPKCEKCMISTQRAADELRGLREYIREQGPTHRQLNAHVEARLSQLTVAAPKPDILSDLTAEELQRHADLERVRASQMMLSMDERNRRLEIAERFEQAAKERGK